MFSVCAASVPVAGFCGEQEQEQEAVILLLIFLRFLRVRRALRGEMPRTANLALYHPVRCPETGKQCRLRQIIPSKQCRLRQIIPSKGCRLRPIIDPSCMVGSFLWAAYRMVLLSSSRTNVVNSSRSRAPEAMIRNPGRIAFVGSDTGDRMFGNRSLCVFAGTLPALATKHGIVQYFRRTKLRSNGGRSYGSTAESPDDTQQGTPIGA